MFNKFLWTLQMEELGRLISNISSVVPEGIVVFFPSFEYENQVYTAWMTKGILATIQVKKHVFREPRTAAAVESTLKSYKDSITQASDPVNKSSRVTQRGALLLCVVGGKMSEGINFSDGMGRCVVMVGLPYPSPSDPELIERMKYIDQLSVTKANIGNGTAIGAVTSLNPLQRCSQQRGRDYYENLCMKAVNQSIGKLTDPFCDLQ
jgi:chromosome transmission fidelity protein 1